MKTLFKILQYIFKLLASLLSKMGAQYTYTRIYKYLMRYKFISLIYKPIKYVLSNLISFIKLAGAILTIFSLFNLSIIYYDFDIIEHINDLINKIIDSIKRLYSKWFANEDDEIISEPVDFLHYKKDTKIIRKAVEQTPNNTYWILPLMILGGIGLYYYNPHLNLEEIINPVLSTIEDKLPSEYVTTFVSGTFIYKFITVSISYLTGYDLNIFPGDDDSLNDDDKANIKSIIDSYKDKSRYSPIDTLNDSEKKEYGSYFSDDEEDINTPKPSTSNLPDLKNPPYIENPFKKIKFTSQNSNEIKIENWD